MIHTNTTEQFIVFLLMITARTKCHTTFLYKKLLRKATSSKVLLQLETYRPTKFIILNQILK